jgi:hypothetical protein
MRIFARLFRKHPATPPKRFAHAVLVNFSYTGSTDLTPLFELEMDLEVEIIAANVGELDGNEVATDGSDGMLFMYGPDADRLFETVKPVLEACSFMKDARVTLRYGSPGAEQRVFVLGS